MKYSKLIILGSGPAGYTAALYAARANLQPILITGILQGGQLTKTYEIENYPGCFEKISGSALMDIFLKQVKNFDVEVIHDHIHSVNLKRKPIEIIGDTKYICKALIIATGSSPKYLGLQNEEEFIGRGVSVCATCDGFFYKNKKVCVVGGGNTAMEEALYLSKIAQSVTIIHRRDKFRGEKILVDKVMQKIYTGEIKIEWNSAIQEIFGNTEGITGICILDKNKKEKKTDLQGIFIAIGHQPNIEIFSDQLDMRNGYIRTDLNAISKTSTNIPGVFAAGDIQDNIYRQAITAAGSGCMAALDAQRYLENLEC